MVFLLHGVLWLSVFRLCVCWLMAVNLISDASDHKGSVIFLQLVAYCLLVTCDLNSLQRR